MPVVLLALGQTLIYASIYYAFPALLPDLVAGTGWSVATLAAGPTLAFLVMAVATPLTGRLVDRGYGGAMLTWMPVLAALAVAGMAVVTAPWQWLVLWGLIGVAQAGCLYETLFAFLTRRLGTAARGAITKVTLVAGFAGTLSFPLGGVLGHAYGGQGAWLAFAAIILVGVVPLNAWGVRALRRQERRAGPERGAAAPGALGAALRKPVFWGLIVVFGLVNLNHGILLTYVLMLFEDRGASIATATLAAACIGPSQVLGRLVLMMFEARIGNGLATVLSLGAIAAAGVLLWAAGAAPVLIFGFAALQGAGAGLQSILRPLLIVDKLGRQGFGTVSGAIAVSPILASAAAPALGAVLLVLGGPGVIYAACLAMALSCLGIGIWVLQRFPQV